ncbi:glycosyltransferase family 4 protein [Geobacillus proteiniphilus]|uniref:Glycosyltransferase family 4 protein n=1 Tax=Geobacillus proteiniphilus TaxID=860353 RepID=A0ABY9MFD5_9BACL|nr:glycosyltransferase family 4 protein [Geobacillus proteiniphilus]WMJ16349.1 glycosyltransferase family 4 protein [Geobacillus proteiniphilus]
MENTLKVTYLAYANLFSKFAGGPEASAITKALDDRGFLSQVIVLDSTNKTIDNLTMPLPPIIRWVVPRILDRLTAVSPISMRYVNERILDITASRYFSPESNLLLTSCVAPKIMEKAQRHGVTTIFYAKNSFNFYSVLYEESKRWEIQLKTGELDYLRRYDEIVSKTDYFVVLSKEDVKILNKDYSVRPEYIYHINLGIDVEQFMPKRKRMIDKKIVFGFLGMSPLRKGLPYLLEAWKVLDWDNHLIVAGLPDYLLRQFKKRWGNLKNVEFYGPVKAKWFYDSIDVYVAPALAEGQPRATMEAMACELPVIATKIGAGEALRHKCEGIIVPERNVDSLVNAMQKMSDPELRYRFGRAGRQRIAKSFKAMDFGQQFVDILYSISLINKK